MTKIVFGIIAEAFIDTIKVFPFLFFVYILIEYLEHRHSDRLSAALGKLGPFGSVGGALLGSIPQCGFSAAASNLYAGRMISLGTLIAVYTATSDEAIPLILSDHQSAGGVWKLIGVKVIIAIAAGTLADVIVKLFSKKSDNDPHFDELCRDCDCEHHHIAVSALIHSGKISLFIFIVNLVLGAAFEFAGAEAISKIMMSGSPIQPLIAAIFGFIPNCAASVIITQLYIEGALTFGSCVAGLCTGAGAGLLVLFKANRRIKENLTIMGILYAVGAASGLILNLFM